MAFIVIIARVCVQNKFHRGAGTFVEIIECQPLSYLELISNQWIRTNHVQCRSKCLVEERYDYYIMYQ